MSTPLFPHVFRDNNPGDKIEGRGMKNNQREKENGARNRTEGKELQQLPDESEDFTVGSEGDLQIVNMWITAEV